MRKRIILYIVLLFCAATTFAQKKVYFTEPGELILQFTQTDIENNTAKNAVRASYFTNLPYYININFSNNFGLITGFAIKNIGIKTKNEQIDTTTYDKIKRRVFTSGLSLAGKVGVFDKGFWMCAGAGIDWAFHYRQKLYLDKKVSKEGEWFSNATPNFIPSVFVGIQTPISLNIKFTYYFNDFINNDYNGSLGDFSKFSQSRLATLSFSIILKELSENFKAKNQLDNPNKNEREAIEL